MNKLLEKNINVLKDNSLKTVLETYTCKQQPVLIQTNGYNIQYQDIKLHDETNPLQESKNTFAKLKNDENAIHLIYGLGLGYLFQIASSVSKGLVILYEPNLDILYNTFSLVDFSADLAKSNVYVFNDFEKLQNFLVEKATNNSYIEIASLPSYRELYKDVFDSQIKALELAYGSVLLDYTFKQKKLYRATYNTIRNIPELVKEIPINKLENCYKDKTAIIVSAGPTLSENIEVLKSVQDKAIIFAVGSALKTLVKNGIKVDFLCIVEAYNCSKQVSDLDLSDINLIVEPFTHPMIHSLPVKQRYLHVSSNMPPSEYWGKMSGIDTEGYLTQGTVSYMALNTAVKMGCSKIILVGQDLAYIEGQCYSKDSAYSELECRYNEQAQKYEVAPKDYEKYRDSLSASDDVAIREKVAQDRLKTLNSSLYTVKSINGSLIPTEAGYAAFIKQFADYAKTLAGIELINTSMKGAQINGFENITLKDAVQGLVDIDKNIPKVEAGYDIEKIKDGLSLLENNLTEFKKVADDSGKIASRLSMDWKRNKNIDKNLLLKIRTLIENYTKMNDTNVSGNEVFLYSTTQAEMELNALLKTVKTYDMTTTPKVIKQLSEYYTFIQKRIDVMLYWAKKSKEGIS